MKTITFYSYKGGVGRTLALSNIAKRLNEFGKKVFIIDFDLEAPGVHYKFNDYIRHDKIKNGIVDYIYEFSNNKNVEDNLKKYVRSFKINSNSRLDIKLMCAGNNYSSEYWKKLSSINWNDLFYKKSSEGIEFFLNLKQKIKETYNPDYLLIDSRTGFTETSAITMSILADEVMIFSANNIENIEGSKQIIKSIKATPSLNEEEIKTHFILTRIPGLNSVEDKIAKSKILAKVDYLLNKGLKEEEKIVKKIHIIHTDRELEIEETFKIGYENKSNTLSVSNDYLNLLKVISNFSEEELLSLNSIVESDNILAKALQMPEGEMYEKELKRAYELNKNNAEILFHLANYYFVNFNIEEALKYLEEAHTLEPHNTYILSFLGGMLLNKFQFSETQDDLDRALSLLEEAIKISDKNNNLNVHAEILFISALRFKRGLTDKIFIQKCDEIKTKYPDMAKVHNLLAVFANERGEIEKAYSYVYDALRKDSNEPLYLTTLAEINAKDGKINEFYFNIDQALKTGYEVNSFFYYHKFYEKYFNDPEFINIIEKYNQLERFNASLTKFKSICKNS